MALPLRHLINGLLLAVLIFTLALPVTAKPRAQPTPIEFTVFARYRQQNLQFLPDAQSPPQSLEFFGNTRSPAYSYTGKSRQLPIYEAAPLTAYWEALTRDPRNPPALPVPVAIADIPEGLTRALLLFIPVRNPPAGQPRLRVYVVDDSPHTLPAGFAAVINASGREYKAQLGEEIMDVPHGIGGKVPATGTVELRLATQDGNDWVVSGRHTFRLGNKDRVSLVFFPPTSPTGIAPIIRTLIDTMPDEKPPVVANASR